ncbi:hypothetical protein [uncultured Methanospirillum sp.]|uniref:hypothetical protein n=1 Tax=uncultured Methanospirillum sp. TaxID=262503 RepID=UPI003747B3B1
MYYKQVILYFLLIVSISFNCCFAEQQANQSLITVKIPISDILNTADNLVGKTICVDGKITSQCGSGCWFIMSDESGDLYVTLKPNNFVIPPSIGKKVTVTGNILIKDNDVTLVGSSVDVEGSHFS